MTQRTFDISVAGWSFHREITAGRLTSVDAIQLVREELDLGGFELVNTLLEVPTAAYVSRLSKAAALHDVSIPLIMCDNEGTLGADDDDARRKAVRYHSKWVYIAADLGCHAIRVNWAGFSGTLADAGAVADFIERSVGAFSDLLRIADDHGIDILIENHGGPSSDPSLLVKLMEAVDSPRFGTLPDFGNFPQGTDIYAAIEAMMPWAKALSAKCYDFGDDGQETRIDFERMLEICIDRHGYKGWVGIEFEGDRLAEIDGTRACRDLLRRLRG